MYGTLCGKQYSQKCAGSCSTGAGEFQSKKSKGKEKAQASTLTLALTISIDKETMTNKKKEEHKTDYSRKNLEEFPSWHWWKTKATEIVNREV